MTTVIMISEHVSLSDACASQTATRKGIPNVPSEEAIECMKLVALECYEPLWATSGGNIRISSFFRGPELNKAVRGSRTSQHMLGMAIDIIATGRYTNAQLLKDARALQSYDQVISEYGASEKDPAWVHVSYKGYSVNRNMYLRLPKK